MKNNPKPNQDGIAHLGLLLLFVVLVFAGIGFAGYRVMQSRSGSTNTISKSSIDSSIGGSEATVSDSVLSSDNPTEESQ